MYEVELKVRADLAAVRRRLAERGAESLGTVEQVDTYYDAPHVDFAETDQALRLRRETAEGETTTTMTYKGPLVDERSKTRREVETVVADGDAAATVLEGVDFQPAATVHKERERFAVGEYTVTLDRVEGAGEFVEVETEAEAEGVDDAREGAESLLTDLGLDPDAGIRTSYLGMLLDAQ